MEILLKVLESLMSFCPILPPFANCSPGGGGGCGKKMMEFIWMSVFGQFWGADYENRCYTANFRGLQPRFHEKPTFSAKYVKPFNFTKLFKLPTITQRQT